jgi:hypothetical protein
MATYTQVPGLLNIKGVVGADFSCNLDFSVSLVGYTFDAGIVLQEYPTKRIQAITVTVTDAANGLLSLGLTEAETTAVGPISNKKWYLNWELGGVKKTIIAGMFELSDIPIGQNVPSENDVIIETPEVNITLTSLTGAAVNINATNDTTTNASFFPVFVASAGTGQQAKVSTTKLSFNPSTGNLAATSFAGNLTGNVTGTASNATTSAAVATTATTTNADYYVPFVSNATSQSAETIRVASGVTFNPSTNTLTTANIVGNVTGNSSTATSASTTAINNDNSSNREYFPVFAYQSNGSASQLYGSSTKLKFNPSNGYFTADGGFFANGGDLGMYSSGVHWGGALVFSAEETSINDLGGNKVAGWGAGTNNGLMYITGAASKDLPLRLMDGDAANLATGAYIIVRPSASATTNGTELRNAYAAAKAFTPNTAALSATNRATVILLPGRYDLGTTRLNLDTDFVDIIGLTDMPEQVVITSQVILSDSGTIYQTANDVKIKGVTIDRTGAPAGSGAGRTAAYFPFPRTTAITTWSGDGTTMTIAANGHGLQTGDSVRISGSGNSSVDGVFTVTRIDDNSFSYPSTVNAAGSIGTATERFNLTYIENCVFSGDSSSGMRRATEYAGTYRKCVGGAASFGCMSSFSSGLFEDCVATSDSFAGHAGAGNAQATGTFRRCVATSNSFGTEFASGLFEDCTATTQSFGGYPGGSFNATGIFRRCTGTSDCFGFFTASGTFENCVVTSGHGFGSRSGATATGTFTECLLTNNNSYAGTFTGTMRRCRFVCTGTNNNAINVGDGAKIFDSTLVATGTGNSITAGSAVTISLAGCRMNNSINANVSNNLGTLTESYNLIDSDIN